MRFIIIIFISLTTIVNLNSQAFEGTLTLSVPSKKEMKSSILTVKGNKSILRAEIDSVQEMTVIKDWDARTTIMLRRKNDLKFGFALDDIHGAEPRVANPSAPDNNVSKHLTDEVKIVDNKTCKKVILKSDLTYAEAWITTEISSPLSKFFPEFLGESLDPALYELRALADQLGFIVEYWEKLIATGEETMLTITPEEKEIPDVALHVPADYTVLNRGTLEGLMTGAQRDATQQKQLLDFLEVFGSK